MNFAGSVPADADILDSGFLQSDPGSERQAVQGGRYASDVTAQAIARIEDERVRGYGMKVWSRPVRCGTERLGCEISEAMAGSKGNRRWLASAVQSADRETWPGRRRKGKAMGVALSK